MIGPLRTAMKVRQFANPWKVALQLSLPRRLRILCHPGQPSHWQTLYKVCALNSFKIVTRPTSGYDLGFHFAEQGDCNLPAQTPVINRYCADISKRHVARMFADAFGYELEVDPTTYTGEMVEKSDANYTHDGRIVRGPISRNEVRSGYVYQRLVKATEGGDAIDLRTPLYAGKVPLVYIKRRPIAARFANENTSTEVRSTNEVFSPSELEQLSRFAALMGLDFGEADILRDRDSGLIFVVDVANTPAGPPNGLSRPAAKAAINHLASEFRSLALHFSRNRQSARTDKHFSSIAMLDFWCAGGAFQSLASAL